MKSLQEFTSLNEESDYSKFDALVRAGLANKAQLARIHRILDEMQKENPKFSTADRQIIVNLFNKMNDLITNNKAINQQAKRAVREEVEEDTIEALEMNEGYAKPSEPPPVLVLKRKAIRIYPNETRIALYYNDKLGKYFSVPYSSHQEIGQAPIQSDDVSPV